MKRLFCILLVVMLLVLCGCNATPQETTASTETVNSGPNPKEDDVMNILMIGNSFCYYYVEELYGIAKAAGIDMRVCNVYYSGCKLEMHYNWWKNGEANYDFYVTDENGRNKTEGCSLEYCLQQGNWDVISFQEGYGIKSAADLNNIDAFLATSNTYLDALVGRARELFPNAEFYWHQSWAYEIGYDGSQRKMESKEQQEISHNYIKEFSLRVCQEQNLKRIPSGEAWHLVRHNPLINGTLCYRLNKNNGLGDFYHDGDIGGGQYLNACVWFETLTGQSCIGNTWRPDYELSEEKIAVLQQAAHQAVQNLNA